MNNIPSMVPIDEVVPRVGMAIFPFGDPDTDTVAMNTAALEALEALRNALLAQPLAARYNIAPECLARLFAEALR